MIVVGGASESVIYPCWIQLYMQVVLPLKALSSEKGKKLELLASNEEVNFKAVEICLQLQLHMQGYFREINMKIHVHTSASSGEGCLILKGDCAVNIDVVSKGRTTTKTYVARGIYTSAYQVVSYDDKELVYLGKISIRGYDPYCLKEGDHLLWVLMLKLRMVIMPKLVGVQVLSLTTVYDFPVYRLHSKRYIVLGWFWLELFIKLATSLQLTHHNSSPSNSW